MALSEKAILEMAREMIGWRESELYRLNRLHGIPPRHADVLLAAHRAGDVKCDAWPTWRASMSWAWWSNRVCQSMYVDGYRVAKTADNAPAWELWQRNRMDARQIGVHRAGLAYGASYVTVLPGDPVTVMRGISPRAT